MDTPYYFNQEKSRAGGDDKLITLCGLMGMGIWAFSTPYICEVSHLHAYATLFLLNNQPYSVGTKSTSSRYTQQYTPIAPLPDHPQSWVKPSYIHVDTNHLFLPHLRNITTIHLPLNTSQLQIVSQGLKLTRAYESSPYSIVYVSRYTQKSKI